MYRYEKFVIENYKTITNSSILDQKEGLNIVKHDISEIEQCENKNQVKILESVFYAITELFDVTDIEMQTTGDAHSFFIVTKDEGEIKEGVNSLWLSREKLKQASALEVSGAIIDLILHRTKWSNIVRYKEFKF